MIFDVTDSPATEHYPMGEFQYYVKKVGEGFRILRFDNGYGALVEGGRVTAIAWRPDSRHVTEYYDVSQTLRTTETFDTLREIQAWGPAPAF